MAHAGRERRACEQGGERGRRREARVEPDHDPGAVCALHVGADRVGPEVEAAVRDAVEDRSREQRPARLDRPEQEQRHADPARAARGERPPAQAVDDPPAGRQREDRRAREHPEHDAQPARAEAARRDELGHQHRPEADLEAEAREQRPADADVAAHAAHPRRGRSPSRPCSGPPGGDGPAIPAREPGEEAQAFDAAAAFMLPSGHGMPVSTRWVMRMWLPESSRNAASIP